MYRTITIELHDGSNPDLDHEDLRDFSADVAKFLAEQLGFASVTMTLHGRRGRGGWKTEVVETTL